MDDQFRVVFLCAANVCRSPLAERVMRAAVDAPGLPVVVESAGTFVDPGQPMCEQAAAFGHMSAADHASREVDGWMLATSDLVLAADRSVRSQAARLLPPCRPRLFTLREAAALARAVVLVVESGALPHGAPPLPRAAIERLRWLVVEMDAGRGSIRAFRVEADADIPDNHGPHNHAATCRAITEAADAIARALQTIGGGEPPARGR